MAARFHVSALNGSGNHAGELRGRRQRASAGVDDAHAVPAVRLYLMALQELCAGAQVVTAACFIREGEIVPEGPDCLVLVPGMIRVAGDVEARERNTRRPVVMPLALCQWFDQLVRLPLARLKNA